MIGTPSPHDWQSINRTTPETVRLELKLDARSSPPSSCVDCGGAGAPHAQGSLPPHPHKFRRMYCLRAGIRHPDIAFSNSKVSHVQRFNHDIVVESDIERTLGCGESTYGIALQG